MSVKINDECNKMFIIYAFIFNTHGFVGDVTYVFAVVARDLDGRHVPGPLSNLVTVSMKAPPTSTSSLIIALVILGVILAVCGIMTIATVVVIALWLINKHINSESEIMDKWDKFDSEKGRVMAPRRLEPILTPAVIGVGYVTATHAVLKPKLSQRAQTRIN